jgi:hypothetical protein
MTLIRLVSLVSMFHLLAILLNCWISMSYLLAQRILCMIVLALSLALLVCCFNAFKKLHSLISDRFYHLVPSLYSRGLFRFETTVHTRKSKRLLFGMIKGPFIFVRLIVLFISSYYFFFFLTFSSDRLFLID